MLCIEGLNYELSLFFDSTEHINGWDKNLWIGLKKEECKYIGNRLPLTGELSFGGISGDVCQK